MELCTFAVIAGAGGERFGPAFAGVLGSHCGGVVVGVVRVVRIGEGRREGGGGGWWGDSIFEVGVTGLPGRDCM